MSRLSFAINVLAAYGSDKACPYCQSDDTEALARKYGLLVLRKCRKCLLMYRWPKATAERNYAFYQNAYKQEGLTTELPDNATLKGLCETEFRGTGRDFHPQIDTLKEFVSSGRVLDFGSSWGYGSYQLQRRGYDVLGFEISKPRAEFGREKLGLEILDDLQQLYALPDESFDAIYASHVLEHLPSLRETFTLFARILRPGGVAMIIVPNCGGLKARSEGVHWGPMTNEKHTLSLHSAFFLKNLPSYGFATATCSDPYDAAHIKAEIKIGRTLPAEGEELMVIAQLPPQ